MGGVAILVRARIKQQVIPNLNLLSLEAVAVLIKLNNRYVTIVSAYQPPGRQMQMSDYDKVMNLDNSIIMAGDLNAKHTNWGCRVINPNGTKLLSFIANTPYTNYAPNEPTYFPSDVNRQPDILDILLIKSFPLICTQEALAELDSDHIPVHKLLDLPDYSVQNCMDYVTPNEVKLIVKNLPNKKPPGHDHLTNLMFKKLPAKGIVLMTSLFNFLLRVGHFPLSWKIATIILIKKPGKNKSNPDSYRPISLLTSLSKIFEKVIHTRLLNYLNSAEVIPKFQFGFRPNHSTIQQLFRITEHISNSFEKHCHTGAVFIDVSKAFDKVWHEGAAVIVHLPSNTNSLKEIVGYALLRILLKFLFTLFSFDIKQEATSVNLLTSFAYTLEGISKLFIIFSFIAFKAWHISASGL
ncbi:hypothetical protein QTP88_006338 [Uroleucon formosanum]